MIVVNQEVEATVVEEAQQVVEGQEDEEVPGQEEQVDHTVPVDIILKIHHILITNLTGWIEEWTDPWTVAWTGLVLMPGHEVPRVVSQPAQQEEVQDIIPWTVTETAMVVIETLCP